jgi:hypothetical protein
MDADSDREEFESILRQLDEPDLAKLAQALGAPEGSISVLRGGPLDGRIYNAYSARVLVREPLYYVKKEIHFRSSCQLCGIRGHEATDCVTLTMW